jgi:hypothetical protein
MNTAAAEVTHMELVDQPRTEQPLAVRHETALAEVNAGPLAMAMQAMKAGMSIADMRDMLNLQKEWEANEARKAFVDDMARFKKNPPEILKDKHVEFTTSKGTTAYDHATIGNVCDAIIKAAAEYGFSHRWIPSRGEHGELIITCEVTHRLGHSQLTPLEGPRDDSGTKNVLQANQSTRTYLQRHSVLLAFGFATKDQPDDDGRTAGSGGQYDPAATLQEWTDKVAVAVNLLALNETRKMAGQEFNAAKDVAGWNAFKDVVEKKRAELIGGGA